MLKDTQNIRNFVIIAHIDHGKSTLADRLLEITGTVEKRLMKPQFLDQLELERERGITIKMAPVRMAYHIRNVGNVRNDQSVNNSNIEHRTSNDSEYILNLIDTPGHSDFAYEVSRALAAVEGAVLLVDATQGIQAQTLANFENARKAGLKIIGAVNKIDIAAPEQIKSAAKDLAGLLKASSEDILMVSGKTGAGVVELLDVVIKQVPPPSSTNIESAALVRPVETNGFRTNKLITNSQEVSRALVFDSFYDEHKGVIAHTRMFSGRVRAGQVVKLAAGKREFKVKEVGYFSPELKAAEELKAGSIGYIATGIKDPNILKIGDTIISNYQLPITNYQPLPGYQEPKPVVFVSLYPEDTNKYDEFKQALSKLRLSDSSLILESDYSEVLGRGFKGGFLGRLHFEITAERLKREFDIETAHSFPSVAYKVKRKEDGGKRMEELVTNPKDFPDSYLEAEEPMTKVEILSQPRHLGAILRLKEIFRFSDIETGTLGTRVVIKASLPLSDLIRDLDDKLKSVSEGFASLSYEVTGYRRADVAKLEILVAGNVVPGLTRILPKRDIEREGRVMVEKLKDLLPRQQFAQALQASTGGKIIARENIPALKKDVAGYLYGGDRTRKMKLWKKQQKGKKKLKEIATQSKIKIPARVFKELLKK